MILILATRLVTVCLLCQHGSHQLLLRPPANILEIAAKPLLPVLCLCVPTIPIHNPFFYMRLLQIRQDGGFSLIELVGKHIPRYAILSHTWGADDDEVTYSDFVGGTSESKAGYRKLMFCGRQAANDGLQLFWIDTCCIDKSSSAELSEAINSMYRWYQGATKCYVYLADVSTDDFTKDIQSFRKSRWFTRGWTLQELLAPNIVEFYSNGGDLLGDRQSLVHQITEVTDIPIEAFQGTPLSQFSVEARISWLGERETKREEDAAYCLLGIFDVHMPLLYGEGQKNAFIRLWEVIAKSFQHMQSDLSSPELFFQSSKASGVPLSVGTPVTNLDLVEQPTIPAFRGAYMDSGASLNFSIPNFEGNKLQHRLRPGEFRSLDGRKANHDDRKENKDAEATFKDILSGADVVNDENERGTSRLHNDAKSYDEMIVNKHEFAGKYAKSKNETSISKPLLDELGGAFGNQPMPQNVINLTYLLQRFIDLEVHINGTTSSLRCKPN